MAEHRLEAVAEEPRQVSEEPRQVAARLHVIITAAGSSRRLGVNKLLLPLGGAPVLVRTCQVFQELDLVADIVITAPAGLEDEYARLLKSHHLTKVAQVVTGGAERQDSIYQAMLALKANASDYVAVHDAARPLISAALVEKICRALDNADGAIPAVAVKDTIKRVDAEGLVLETLVRSELRAVQTPQIFRFGPLLAAYNRAQQERYLGTDDASLIEYMGGKVRVVEGDYRNIKVTTVEDIAAMERFWEELHGRNV